MVQSDFLFFFFSSRRRHTRLVSDWSSDVCSSDLPTSTPRFSKQNTYSTPGIAPSSAVRCAHTSTTVRIRDTGSEPKERSEERRVGKECRSRWSPDHEKKTEI